MRFCALFLLTASFVSAATCDHSITQIPIGPLLVYRNGILLWDGEDYNTVSTPGSFFTAIQPINFGDGDKMQVVYTRGIPLTFPVNGIIIPYFGYALFRERWTCSGSQGSAHLLLRLDPSTTPGLQHATTIAGREYYLVDWPPK